MKNIILEHLNDPSFLERLYRENRTSFRREFNGLYPEIKGNTLADYWNERLNYESRQTNRGSRRDFIFIVIIALIAGFIAKFPAIFSIEEEFFYPRNLGFIIFPALSAYFAWKNKLSIVKIGFIVAAMLVGLVFINLFPGTESDTLILSCIHLLLFLWCILGFSFTGEKPNDSENRLDFLKYNGDLVVISALILIAGGIMTGVTIGLFQLLGLNIEEFYFENIVIFGLPAIPILGTYLIRTNPNLVGKVSPIIARIFSPLVLVMLVLYLGALIYSGKDPYNDREFLLVFNVLLIGVMALIFFSVAETSGEQKSRTEKWILFLLSVVTIIVNGIALSAILFRISEWGITPNRAAVMGGNVLILINLFMVTAQLFRVVFKDAEVSRVGRSITFYLPVYFLWTIIVTFLFPLIFGFE